MRDQVERRLTELRKEYQDGEKQAADLESKLSSLRATLQRIRGAIQVLEEMLAEQGNPPASA